MGGPGSLAHRLGLPVEVFFPGGSLGGGEGTFVKLKSLPWLGFLPQAGVCGQRVRFHVLAIDPRSYFLYHMARFWLRCSPWAALMRNV